MSRIRDWLARRTEGERLLTVVLGLVTAALIWVWIAWKRDLEPMATDYGTVADWVAAIGTILAILVAAYTFWKGSTATRRAEAQRVVTTWHTEEKPNANVDEGEYRYLLVATIYNFGSTPVRDVSLLLNLPAKARQWSIGGDLKANLQVIAPGKAEAVEFPVTRFSPGLLQQLHMQGLNKDTIVQFADASGLRWRNQHIETMRIYESDPDTASDNSSAVMS